MKKGLVLGVLLVFGGLAFARGGRDFSGSFTLATPAHHATAVGSMPISFILAPSWAASIAPAGPTGLGVIEEIEPTCNTAIGGFALASNTTGTFNTAVGFHALYSNTEGQDNIACGSVALEFNTTGSSNLAVGDGALRMNTTGGQNTAIGFAALFANTDGAYNLAYGPQSLLSNTSGQYNTAIGYNALHDNTTGINNIAVGSGAGYYNTTGRYNIYLGAVGTAEDTHTIRIGTPCPQSTPPPYGQNRTYIAGIADSAFAAGNNPAIVGITSDGLLGTVPPELLPVGPQGPAGPAGAQGPPGPGLVSGSLLMLPLGVASPAGYRLLGSTSYIMRQPNGRFTTLTVNIFQKL